MQRLAPTVALIGLLRLPDLFYYQICNNAVKDTGYNPEEKDNRANNQYRLNSSYE
jgi:hypothetical protein